MSVISNRHTVNPFTAGKSEALNGQRLARVLYKPSKGSPAKYPSVCVSVPSVEPIDQEYISRLMPHIVQMVNVAQDGIIKSLYESSDGTLREVSDSDISLDSVCAYLESESTGGRLTIEGLNQWFDANVRDNLTVVIADKLGFDLSTPEQEVTVSKHVSGYKGMIASLSGAKTFYQPAQIAGIKRALEVSSVDDDISKKLIARLIQMEQKPDIAELLEL